MEPWLIIQGFPEKKKKKTILHSFALRKIVYLRVCREYCSKMGKEQGVDLSFIKEEKALVKGSEQ